MPKLQSCGFFIYRTSPELSFLLMQHRSRWDLAKGHVDPGETEMQCALRELEEETGIRDSMIEIDDSFRYDQNYTVTLARYNHQPREKTLTIFMAKLLVPDFTPTVTEHLGHRWVEWHPPHQIQEKTIDPLLAAVAQHWSTTTLPE